MKIKRDQIMGLLLILAGIAVAILVSQFKKDMTAVYPGPKLFPLIGAFGFVVCGLGIFVGSCLSKKEEDVFLVKAGWIKVFTTFAILCVYVLLMKYLGYMIVTPFVVFALECLIAKGGGGEIRSLRFAIFAILFTIIIYVMYVMVFGLTLPSGKLF